MLMVDNTSSSDNHPTTSLIPNAPSQSMPFIPSNLDYHSLQITPHRLNGTNFQEWFQSILLVIKGKGKVGYLDGSLPMPPKTAPNYST